MKSPSILATFTPLDVGAVLCSVIRLPVRETEVRHNGAVVIRTVARRENRLADSLRRAVAAHDEIVQSNLPAVVKASFAAYFNADEARELLAEIESKQTP